MDQSVIIHANEQNSEFLADILVQSRCVNFAGFIVYEVRSHTYKVIKLVLLLL